MRLHFSPTSPYVRKVLACAIARGIEAQIERVPTNAHASPPDLLAGNPLSKVPCLVTDDGLALFDSPVICEYLDTVGDENPLFPAHGAGRWRALKQQALGDGVLDAGLLRRAEAGRPKEAARDAVIERQRGAILRSLDALEAEPPSDHLDIGTITLACALGYLDFRFADEPWREAHPKLAAWYARISAQPCLGQTAPKDP